MPKYHVEGAAAQTGRRVRLSIRAKTEERARAFAEKQGMTVQQVTVIEEPPPPIPDPIPKPASWVTQVADVSPMPHQPEPTSASAMADEFEPEAETHEDQAVLRLSEALDRIPLRRLRTPSAAPHYSLMLVLGVIHIVLGVIGFAVAIVLVIVGVMGADARAATGLILLAAWLVGSSFLVALIGEAMLAFRDLVTNSWHTRHAVEAMRDSWPR